MVVSATSSLSIRRKTRNLRFSLSQTLNARASLREEMRTTRFNGVELPVRVSLPRIEGHAD